MISEPVCKIKDELSTLRQENRNLNVQNDQNKQLINNLEQDLMRVHNVQLVTDNEVAADQSTLDLISDAVGYNKQTIAKQSLSPTNAQSLLPVVANQRERLRVRVEELEEINMQNQQQTAVLNGQIERLQADNVKLYEKIKFLQSYQSQTKVNDGNISFYPGNYEASLDPFQRFGVQERQKRYMALSTRDKATLSISRIIINNPTARAVFFFYLLLLHCLVFLVLYRLAYTESCQRSFDTECMENYRQHMQMAHGDDHNGLAKKIEYSPAG
uniref:Protein CASP n=1 Tax=Romanomermis culicivorax TaxID=13658 RepID=A0A915HUC7_ROMCU